MDDNLPDTYKMAVEYFKNLLEQEKQKKWKFWNQSSNSGSKFLIEGKVSSETSLKTSLKILYAPENHFVGTYKVIQVQGFTTVTKSWSHDASVPIYRT